MKSIKLIAIFTFILSFISCEEKEENPIICTLNFVHGLEINLVEKTTLNPVNGLVKIVVKDGNYEEILENDNPNISFYAAGERRGTYIITITSDNYNTSVSDPIIVSGDECHVFTEKRTFELELK